MMPSAITCRAEAAALLILVVFLVLAGIGVAQDRTPAPASFAGTWTLDPYLSDRPEQVARALRFNTGEAALDELAGGMAGRGAPGRGEPVRGGSGGGGRPEAARGSSSEKTKISEDDQKLLREATILVRFPPSTLTITHTEGAVTLATDAGASYTLRTNGKTEKQQLGAGTVDRAARWEGPHLVVEYEVGKVGTLRYTYLLAPTTGQLVVRVGFDRRPEQPGLFEIKRIYNPASSRP